MESQEPASRSMGQPEKGDVWNFHLRKNGDGDDVGDGDGDDDDDDDDDDGDDGGDDDGGDDDDLGGRQEWLKWAMELLVKTNLLMSCATIIIMRIMLIVIIMMKIMMIYLSIMMMMKTW